MDIGTDERRVAIEAIATLVHIKSTMASLILSPAGVPVAVYRPLLNKRDEITGRALSKRQVAPLILDAVARIGDSASVVRKIIEIAAGWSSFHLADNEYEARATVQKAREVLGKLEQMEAQEVQQGELARKDELVRMERERADIFRKQSELLLMMFDGMARSDDHQQRGYLLEQLLNQTFVLHGIPVFESFTRNGAGEQIDGAVRLDGWYYLVECRWREKLSDIGELDALRGKVDRSGKQTMGLFFSVNGWSVHVPALLKQNSDKAIILVEGFAFRSALCGNLDLEDYISAVVANLNLKGEPALSVDEYLRSL